MNELEAMGQTPRSDYSQPNAAVRHSYPLTIERGDLATAFSLLLRSWPYTGARFLAHLATSVATIVWWAFAIGGAAFFGAKVHQTAGVLWFFGWAIVFGWTWRAFVRYFLFLLKAGHIVVLTELITQGRVSNGGEHMFEYGKRVVTDRFVQIHALWAFEQLIAGIVSVFNRTLNWVASLLPIPNVGEVMGVVNRVVRAATSYIDETLLSYSLARGDSDHYRSARDGLIYYAQNSQEVLKTGVWIVVLDKVSTVVTWIIMFVPAVAIGTLLPQSVRGLGILVTAGLALILAWAVRAALLEPLFLTMMMIKFHVCVRNQPINLEWDARLSSVSEQFVELKNKVGQYATNAASGKGFVTS